MAKIDQNMLKQWQDGETIHGPEYSGERDLLVAAHNDTQQQLDILKGPSSITTAQLQDGAVTTAKLANSAVATAKIQNGAVTSEKLAEKAVTTTALGDSAVTTDKLSDSSVTTTKLNTGAVTAPKISDGAVVSRTISESAVVTNHINAGAVTTEKLSDSAVNSYKLSDGAVTTSKLQNLAVTSAKLANGAVTETKITKAAVTQFTYERAEIDQRIADAIAGGIPQNVIDQIRDDLFGAKDYNRLSDDFATLSSPPSAFQDGLTFFKATAPVFTRPDMVDEPVCYLVMVEKSNGAARQAWYVLEGIDLKSYPANEYGVANTTYVRYSMDGSGWSPFVRVLTNDSLPDFVPNASTSVRGVVQLSSALNSSSETEAATPKAVRDAIANTTSLINSAPETMQRNTGSFTIVRSNKDANGTFRTVTYKRPNGTTFMVSQLIDSNSDGKYESRREEYYNSSGTTVNWRKTWTLTYDTDGALTQETLTEDTNLEGGGSGTNPPGGVSG